MKRAAVGSALLSCLLAGCGPADVGRQTGRSRVVVSIPPLADIVGAVALDQAEIEIVLPGGATPESWAATPGAMLAVADADLLVVVGHPEISFERRLLAQAGEAGVPVVRLAAGGTEAAGDPHLWLDLDLMRTAARSIAEVLADAWPRRAADLVAASTAFDLRVEELDLRLQALFSTRRLDWVLVQHPAWARLLGRYGIDEVAVEAGGKEATSARLIELIERVRRFRPGVLIAQRGLSDRGVQGIARETGVRVETLDPLSARWFEGLETSAETLAGALR